MTEPNKDRYYPAVRLSSPQFLCNDCGAVVWHREKHDMFHAGLVTTSKQASEGDAWAGMNRPLR